MLVLKTSINWASKFLFGGGGGWGEGLWDVVKVYLASHGELGSKKE